MSLNFEQAEDELQPFINRLDALSVHESVLLNQAVHNSELIERPARGSGLGPNYEPALEDLLGESLLIRSEDGALNVPDDVVYLPNGPGVRQDQISGCLHNLSTEALEAWLERLDESTPEPDTPDRVLYRRLVRRIQDTRDVAAGSVSDLLPGDRWTSIESLDRELPEDPVDLYERLSPESDPFDRHVLNGILLPWLSPNGTVVGFVLEHSFHADGETINHETEPLDAQEEDWERTPFSPAEQLKFLLIASDAVPFRSTQDNHPHRFDLKEVHRVSDWPLNHLERFTWYLIETGLIDRAEDRFFLTERALEWDQGEFAVNPFVTRTGPGALRTSEDEPPLSSDLSSGMAAWGVLDQIREFDQPVRGHSLASHLARQDFIWESLMVADSRLPPSSENRKELARQYLNQLHEFGLLDRSSTDDGTWFRSNDRVRSLREDSRLSSPEHEELPYILQPDGNLLVPLESPLDEFRRINPFSLLVKADRMLGYQIDRQSLVQALNEGWDALQFREFLESRADRIPEPVLDLLDETIGDVESVEIRRVHHLIEFETGATAAKAVNVLSNYNPLRLDETTLILRSKTSEETIRRNLSRGGIRLSTSQVDKGQSPVLSVDA